MWRWMLGRRCRTCGHRVFTWKGAGVFGIEGNPPRRHGRCRGAIL